MADPEYRQCFEQMARADAERTVGTRLRKAGLAEPVIEQVLELHLEAAMPGMMMAGKMTAAEAKRLREIQADINRLTGNLNSQRMTAELQAVQRRLAYSDDPLQPEQFDAFVNAVTESNDLTKMGNFRLLTTDATMEQAKKMLTWAQYQAFLGLREEALALVERSKLPK
ncbi:hypothetical protein [Oleiharenicola lentus]|uniref:hypothetical protein n=1 Tax=Oleiharenicola lentus TaxID=2508720 RepID=UPI003F6791EC